MASVAALLTTLAVKKSTADAACVDDQPLARETSVVVVAYNSGSLLRSCVASIVHTQPEVEVVIVDNNSTDEAVQQVAVEFPQVRIVWNTSNAGFGAGNNLGVDCAERKFLVFLNHDVIVTAGWLEALVAPLAEDPSIGLVTPKVLLRSDPSHINVAGLKVHLSGISMCRGLGSSRESLDKAAEVAAISGVAFAVRREVYKALEGFDESFFLYLEDVDISARAWLRGYRCLYVPHAVVLHDYDKLEMGVRKTFWVERGRYLLLLKLLRWRTLIALLPSLILSEIVTYGWLLLYDPKAALQKIRAWGWIWANRCEIAQKRRQVQETRVMADAVFVDKCNWDIDFGQLSSPFVARIVKALLNPAFRGAALLAHLLVN